jgi:hypothetical protein
MRRSLGLVGIAALAVGCASGTAATPASSGAPRKEPGGERSLPIPADLAPHVAESIEIGRDLYLLDKASAIGTDVALAKVPDFHQRGVGGWLTVQEADDAGTPTDGFAVMFITREEPLHTLFRIDVPFRVPGPPKFREFSPPQPLDELGVRLFRARQTAIAAVPRGPRNWNPVVLPGGAVGRPDAIAVYLLAAEQRPGEMVFGIHYRVLVSSDGTRVEAAIPLSKSALVLPAPQKNVPAGAKPVAAMVTQIVTDWPLETHVFVSLLHGRHPIYVGTKRGIWLVVGDKISLIDDRTPGS